MTRERGDKTRTMDKKWFKAFTRLTRQNYFSDIEREDNQLK